MLLPCPTSRASRALPWLTARRTRCAQPRHAALVAELALGTNLNPSICGAVHKPGSSWTSGLHACHVLNARSRQVADILQLWHAAGRQPPRSQEEPEEVSVCSMLHAQEAPGLLPSFGDAAMAIDCLLRVSFVELGSWLWPRTMSDNFSLHMPGKRSLGTMTPASHHRQARRPADNILEVALKHTSGQYAESRRLMLMGLFICGFQVQFPLPYLHPLCIAAHSCFICR